MDTEGGPIRVAATQSATVVANVDANLEVCERLANAAARHGAQWIILPEVFTTGMSFVPKIADCVLPPDGRHDKDIPTMWESCFYVGGTDDGVMRTATCWLVVTATKARA